ncbi:tRNA guanosine(34) transglycosylase Tgt [soil metagenome]
MDVSSPFRIVAQDGPARTGWLSLPRGEVQTPVFMPVGTQASVKSLDPPDLTGLGAEIILANTYHLMLRPGADLIENLGGVSHFMRWDKPVLTDSGGFQVFSLAQNRKLNEEGVAFRSHIDGSLHELSPERAVKMQAQFGSDIIMALDVCVGYDAGESAQRDAMELTHRWLPRNLTSFGEHIDIHEKGRSLLFGICQGGFDASRRSVSARVVNDSPVDGCAIGGLSVGEPKDVMAEMLESSISALDSARPRYLMGVGSPEDLWNAVAVGVDMFDCVLPTRVARRGALYTADGRVIVTSQRYATLDQSLDSDCDCYTCQTFSVAYLHHLFRTKELLAYRLGSIHNLRFLMRQMEAMRSAIRQGVFDSEHKAFIERYQVANQAVAAEQRARYRQRQART